MLKGKEKRTLRAEGTHLSPEVWIGKDGISRGTIQSLENSFRSKELVKVKILDNCDLEKTRVAKTLSESAGAELVQILGRTILLYRPLPEEGGKLAEK